MHTEDRQIIHQCLSGNKESFTFLVDKYKASVFALAYSRLRNFHDAEDITSEAFLSAYQRLATLRNWDSFMAWLHAIAANLCRNFRRSHARRLDTQPFDEKLSTHTDELSWHSYQESELHRTLHEHIADLPTQYAEVLSLYYLGGLSIKDIARVCYAKPNTIAQRLRRARAQLEQELLAALDDALPTQPLPATFTFRLAEAIRRIRIRPAPTRTSLPIAIGIVVLLLSMVAPMSPFYPVSSGAFSALSSQMQVLEQGELPVSKEVTHVLILSGEQTGAGFSNAEGQEQNTLTLSTPFTNQSMQVIQQVDLAHIVTTRVNGIDYDGTRFWASDIIDPDQKAEVHQIDTDDGRTLINYTQNHFDPVVSNVRGIAYDAQNQWMWHNVYPGGLFYAVSVERTSEDYLRETSRFVTELDWLHDIAWHEGHLYAARGVQAAHSSHDEDIERVYQIAPSTGKILDFFTTPANAASIRGIAFDSQGVLWVAEFSDGKVYQVDLEHALYDGHCKNAVLNSWALPTYMHTHADGRVSERPLAGQLTWADGSLWVSMDGTDTSIYRLGTQSQ